MSATVSRWWLGVAVAVCLGVLVAWSHVALQARTKDDTPASARRGDEVYRTACISCHGPDGRGQPVSTVGFDVPLPNFTDCGFATAERNADWHTIIEQGGRVRALNRKMPAFKDALTGEEIERVIAYIRTFCQERQWPRGDLNLPRPLVTEKAFPENEAVVTTTYQGGRDGSLGNSFVYEHRLGARAQYEVVVPFDLQKTSGSWNHGLGDVAIAAKRVMYADVTSGAIVSLGGEVTFPTGKESLGLGSGVTILEPFLAYSQRVSTSNFLHVHAGVEHSTNHDLAEDEAYLRAAIGHTFLAPHGGHTWSPMFEVLAARELAPGMRVQWDVVPQLQVTLSRRQHVMLNGGLQLPVNERDGRHRRALVYFLWDWFDGGFTSGW
jgi:mono/diheme cytochrome c family protein